MSFKHNLRSLSKFLNWLFKGKSLASQVAFLVFAYLSFKFILFPGFLGLTGLTDVVAVISGSMHHQPGSVENTFTGWLTFNGFNETTISSWPFEHGMDVGDAVTIVQGEISIGDVVIYYYDNKMIIHRVINITNIEGINYYTTKGDANPESLTFEVMIPESRIVGKASNRVPWIGWPRTIMYYLIGA
ncbi:MAG: signal peptidase I [Candidatus Nanoarchaeia archaeon]|jgi:signal peptidase I